MATKGRAKAPAKKRKPTPVRPPGVSDAVFEYVCLQIAEGKSLVTICKPTTMPSRSTVHRWIAANPVLLERYLEARGDQADYYADEIVDIADTVAKRRHVSKEEIAAARLRIDTRKWYAGKVRPKKWGDKIDVNVQQTTRTLAQATDTELQDELVKAAAELTAMGVEIPAGVALLIANGAQGSADADAG